MSSHKAIPGGSSAFNQVMSEIVVHPVVEFEDMDAPDRSHEQRRNSSTPAKHGQGHLEEGSIVHGLHHCYKVEGGHYSTSFRCNHDHCRASNGHLEEISKTATSSLSPLPVRRRASIVASGSSLLSPEEGTGFRTRANSDAFRNRRSSMANGHGNGTGSVPDSPGKNSPAISPAPRRRGSNAVLQSDELHHVYDQFLASKR